MNLRRVAIHEAGHAVVAAFLGVPMVCAKIESDGWSVGRVELGGDRPDSAPGSREILILVAGLAAEQMFCSRQDLEAPIQNDVDRAASASLRAGRKAAAVAAWPGGVTLDPDLFSEAFKGRHDFDFLLSDPVDGMRKAKIATGRAKVILRSLAGAVRIVAAWLEAYGSIRGDVVAAIVGAAQRDHVRPRRQRNFLINEKHLRNAS